MKDVSKQFREEQIQMAHKHKKLLKVTSSQRSAKPCTKEPQTQGKFEKEITTIQERRLEGKKGVIYCP